MNRLMTDLLGWTVWLLPLGCAMVLEHSAAVYCERNMGTILVIEVWSFTIICTLHM